MADKSTKSRAAIAAAISLIIAAILLSGWWFSRGPTDQVALPSATATAPSIKVGVIISKFTAYGPTDIGQPYGYERQWRILREMQDRSFDIFPIIDPGTQEDPELADVLSTHFPGKNPIDGSSAAQLQTLDVIVASHTANLEQAQIDALEQAVTGGKGLLIRMFLGLHESGNTPQILALNGLKSGQYAGLGRGQTTCQVVGEHPLLGSLSGKFGHAIVMQPNGFYGTINGTPLVVATDTQGMFGIGRQDTFACLFVAELGRGRIVNCAFAGSKPVPDELESADDEGLTIRSIKWLAATSGPQ